MELSEKQKLVYAKYEAGENIFMTGAGGTGKTELIKRIVKDAKEKGIKYQVCALTGCACILLKCNAKTIHSWGGLGLCNGDIDLLAGKIALNKFKRKNWKQVELLIVDEVSMMSKKLFNALNLIGKKCRLDQSAFGGIQVIFSGDFNQLSPIGNDDEPDTSRYCFESEDWDNIFKNQIELVEIFRQKDPVYTKILSQIRNGKLTRKSVDKLNSYVGRKIPEDILIKPTIIYPTRNKVEKINNESLEKINEDVYTFKMQECTEEEIESSSKTSKKTVFDRVFTESQKQTEINYLRNNINCDNIIHLKKGAQVMCIANLDMENDICNGSQGIIIDFATISGQNIPVVKFYNNITRPIGYNIWQSENIQSIALKQIPLILSWAITIHKAQGATLDVAEIDIGREIFACGQTYVALSRIKSLEGLYLKSFDPNKIKLSKKVKNYYEKLNKNKEKKEEKKEEKKNTDEYKELNFEEYICNEETSSLFPIPDKRDNS